VEWWTRHYKDGETRYHALEEATGFAPCYVSFEPEVIGNEEEVNIVDRRGCHGAGNEWSGFGWFRCRGH